MQRIEELIRDNRLAEAAALLDKNTKTLNRCNYLFYKGLIAQKNDNREVAMAFYKKVLALDRKHRAAINLARLFLSADAPERVKPTVQALKNTPSARTVAYWMVIAEAELQLGNADKAISAAQAGTDLFPGSDALKNLLAAGYLENDRPDRAIDLLEPIASASLRPSPALLNNLAAGYLESGDNKKALALTIKLLKDAPNFDPAIDNYLLALVKTGRYEEAIKWWHTNPPERSCSPGPLVSLGNAYANLGNSKKACELYSRALALSPKHIAALRGLANAYATEGLLEAAEDKYRQAAAVDPRDKKTQWSWALSLLANGVYRRGWQKYSAGFEVKEHSRGAYAFPRATEWKIGEPADTLIVWGEQGVGDQLMFSQLIRHLPTPIATIRLQIDERLVPVFRSRFIANRPVSVEKVEINRRIPHVPVGNLPRNLTHLFENPPHPFPPFLNRTARRSDKLRIGFTWRGGATEAMQRRRSVPLSRCIALLNSLCHRDSQFVALQYDIVPAERKYLSNQLGNKCSLPQFDGKLDLVSWVDDIDSCDAVISIDNSAVHFAGALGIPTMVLLPKKPDFRWGLKGSASIWYESLYLVRNGVRLDEDQLCKEVSRFAQDDFGLRHK